MSNYHGCKEEAANKLNTTLFDGEIDKMISFDVKQVYSVANILFFTIIYYIYL